MRINNIILKPLVTEKSTQQVKDNTYGFIVNIKAGKNQIAETVESLYKVTVESVRVVIRKGKTRRVGKKMVAKDMPDKKIAYVKLSKGTIDLFPKA